ncbi:protein-disulfide reductase DsbD family protein [Desulfovibrio oxyclinae]|uniref:protein-disulfide reductase DsbD family protein n=1 Tax=Desulfovibrio oxyclinae TaxID=63560 RepID=UPI0003A76FB7|nr:cytochrome c biogenesis protein CcdA [Desulfovibrio oxyclinae]
MNRLLKTILASLLLMLLAAAPAAAQLGFQQQDYPAKTSWGMYALPGGDSSMAVLTMTFEDGWHTYSAEPTGVGKPTTVQATIEPGGMELAAVFPPGVSKPDTFDPSKTANIYDGVMRVFLPIPPDAPESGSINAQVELLFCSDTKCLPARMEIPFRPKTFSPDDLAKAELQPWWPEFLEAFGEEPVEPGGQWGFSPKPYTESLEVTSLGAALFFGLIAGLLLNLMPCVLPVISLKVSALLGSGGEPEQRRREIRTHGIFFAAGVLSWFGALAVILWKTGIAWGGIFQQPEVVAGLAIFVFVMGLSLLGLFDLPVIDLKFDSKVRSHKAQAYFTGLLATLLATPCSGPFLGGVLAWALQQPPGHIAAVFLAVGLGMSSPYLAMSVFPGVATWLPRPGAWVQHVERVVGFFLLGTVLYLINILPPAEVMPALFVMWLAVPAGWLWGLAGPGVSTGARWGLRLAGLGLLGLTLLWFYAPERESFMWTAYNPVTFEERLGREAMFVDFTADWCPTCKVIEATVLTPENLTQWREEYGVRFVQVDLSEQNPEGEELLFSLGSRSLPVAAFFPAGDDWNKPVVLRDLFTEEQVETILESYNN